MIFSNDQPDRKARLKLTIRTRVSVEQILTRADCFLTLYRTRKWRPPVERTHREEDPEAEVNQPLAGELVVRHVTPLPCT